MAEDYTRLVAIPARANVSRKYGLLHALKQATVLQTFGHPRVKRDYTQSCQAVDNPGLASAIKTQDVGPFRATGHHLVLDVLREGFARVKTLQPDLWGQLGNAGMLCCRLVRGTTIGSISNHSWGFAIDLTIAGKLDTYGDGKTQYGMALVAEAMNDLGLFWGAHFGKEDSMHLEASEQLFREWFPEAKPPVLSPGDRGPEVKELQRLLNLHGADPQLIEDGGFGGKTATAVTQFQLDSNIGPLDGCVTKELLALLKEHK